MDAGEKDEEGDDHKPPSISNPRSPLRSSPLKRVLSIQLSSSAADTESIKKQKQEPLCDSCYDRERSGDDLVPITGDWRSIALCLECYCSLQSNAICSYCFEEIHHEGDVCYDCIHCKRSVHFACIAKNITGGMDVALEIKPQYFACFDCVPPDPKPSGKGKEKEVEVSLFKAKGETVPLFKVNEGERLPSPTTCSYCADGFKLDDPPYKCVQCVHKVHVRCIANDWDISLIDKDNFVCYFCNERNKSNLKPEPVPKPVQELDWDPEPVPAKGSTDKDMDLSIQKDELEETEPRCNSLSREKEKDLSIQKEEETESRCNSLSREKEEVLSIPKEEKTEPRYKLRSREKAKASPIIVSLNEKAEPRRSLRSSGKNRAAEVQISASAKPLPNLSLTECHVCGHKAKANPLKLLKSDWRILLVCGTCLVSLGTNKICAYCFDPTSENDHFCCQKCLRAVHFCCIRNHPFYIDRAQLDGDTFTCFDCEAIPNLWKNDSAAIAAAAASIVVDAAAEARLSGEVNADAAGLSSEVNAEAPEADRYCYGSEVNAVNQLIDIVTAALEEKHPDSETEKQPDSK